jgi:uncharacterized protein YndB with AHSA1/START domain
MSKAETQSVTMELNLRHPPAKVWRALTEPELLTKWLMANDDMRPAVGHAFTFKVPGDNAMSVHCEVQEIELHKRLRYSWKGGPLDTVVTWTLSATPSGGTTLRLEHSGFRPTEGGQAVFFDGAKKGWQFRVGQRLVDVLAQLA